MKQKQQNVTIKGSKDGLRLILDDRCSYNELLQEIEDKLSVNTRENKDDRFISVYLETGNRYLDHEQTETIKNLIRRKKKLVVEHIESNVISKEEAEERRKEKQISSVFRMIRSGQVLDVTGDLLLIGDVNPGGKVVATGNIYIMGVLRGIAHAGANGNPTAIIAASSMEPSQLRIANVTTRAPDGNEKADHVMECAYIDDEKNHIVVDRIQRVPWLRRTRS